MSNANPGAGKYNEMFAVWQARQDMMKKEQRDRDAAANGEYWRRKKERTLEARRIRDRDAKRAKRGVAAETIRPYTDCSNMTPGEKAAHVRERERLKKQRQRAAAKKVSPYSTNPNFGMV